MNAVFHVVFPPSHMDYRLPELIEYWVERKGVLWNLSICIILEGCFHVMFSSEARIWELLFIEGKLPSHLRWVVIMKDLMKISFKHSEIFYKSIGISYEFSFKAIVTHSLEVPKIWRATPPFLRRYLVKLCSYSLSQSLFPISIAWIGTFSSHHELRTKSNHL